MNVLLSMPVASAFAPTWREARIPGIVAFEDGSALMCHEARCEQAGDWGDIDIRVLRLEPDGEISQTLRLGEGRLPKDGRMRTWNNPTLIDAGGGRIVLLFNKNYERGFACISTRFMPADSSWNTPSVYPWEII